MLTHHVLSNRVRKTTELNPTNPRDYRYSENGSGLSVSCQPVLEPCHDVHALVKNCQHGGDCIRAVQAENVMSATFYHSHMRMKCAHVFENTLTFRERGSGFFKLTNVKAALTFAPLFVGVPNNFLQITDRTLSEHIISRHLRYLGLRVVSAISVILRVSTSFLSTSAIRTASSDFSSFNAVCSSDSEGKSLSMAYFLIVFH